MLAKGQNNVNDFEMADNRNCWVCRKLLAYLERFYTMLEAARNYPELDWLTVDEVAKELKISRSIVYRLIHHGEIEAVNIVDSNGKIPKKGHYRIKRECLNKYLESKKVRPHPPPQSHIHRAKRFPKVKNYLGL